MGWGAVETLHATSFCMQRLYNVRPNNHRFHNKRPQQTTANHNGRPHNRKPSAATKIFVAHRNICNAPKLRWH